MDGLPPHFVWLLAAILLAGAELLVPGSFLIWIAAAAALTGVASLLTGMPLEGQFIAFAALSAGSVVAGRKLYAARDPGGDPKLNDRVAGLIGQTVEVVASIEHGRGRVRVGDGVWPARGPDTAAGTRVRVIGSEGTCLTVEPVVTSMQAISRSD
jgi:membrane protein implicated in regulation of membrane protease activity